MTRAFFRNAIVFVILGVFIQIIFTLVFQFSAHLRFPWNTIRMIMLSSLLVSLVNTIYFLRYTAMKKYRIAFIATIIHFIVDLVAIGGMELAVHNAISPATYQNLYYATWIASAIYSVVLFLSKTREKTPLRFFGYIVFILAAVNLTCHFLLEAEMSTTVGALCVYLTCASYFFICMNYYEESKALPKINDEIVDV